MNEDGTVRLKTNEPRLKKQDTNLDSTPMNAKNEERPSIVVEQLQ